MRERDSSVSVHRRPLRADARRNRERIVAAAVELFADEGVDVPLDAIARRADVGIGTLYRRFPDRAELLRAVAHHAFTSVRELAAQLRRDPPEQPIARFLQGVAELRVGVLTTSLLPSLTEMAPDPELDRTLEELVGEVERLVEVAQERGELRTDVTADDLLILLALVTRPLDGLPVSYSEAALPRILQLAVDGLRPRDDASGLPPSPPRPGDDELRQVRRRT